MGLKIFIGFLLVSQPKIGPRFLLPLPGDWIFGYFFIFLPLNFIYKKKNKKTVKKTLLATTKKQYFMFLLIPIENPCLVIATVSSCDSYPHHFSDNSTISQQGYARPTGSLLVYTASLSPPAALLYI